MALTDDQLREIAGQLARRPGHETVKAQLHRLLVEGLGAAMDDVRLEQRIEARSRVDTLLGSTVFEVKSDLRREEADAESQLARYLENREHETKHRFTGVATDGAEFRVYELREGVLEFLRRFRAEPSAPRRLLVELEGVTALATDLPADTLTVIAQLGRDSTAYLRAAGVFAKAWARLCNRPDMKLKRDLWADLLAKVYGRLQDDDALWFQHTFLTIVAKSFAHTVLNIAPRDARDLLQGETVAGRGIDGAVESDFFDWTLEDPASAETVWQLYGHVRRFRVDRVDADLLKVLYESLIDPSTRHDLGEYYTPDWLAAKVCKAAIREPGTIRILDPSCGSGTFLFFAIRKVAGFLLAEENPPADVLIACTERIAGIDIHPVAVIIARVTYLLAFGADLLAKRVGSLSIPVYLGDGLQWNVTALMDEERLEVRVPPAEPGGSQSLLTFPVSVCDKPHRFDKCLKIMIEGSERGADERAIREALKAVPVSPDEADAMLPTYRELCRLNKAGRDHVWGYILRNVARPVAFSSKNGRPDLVIGNPPWLSFRFMTPEQQAQLRREATGHEIWVGGKLATQQDLSGYFFVRCVDRYLRIGGRIAFVMPLAAMTRGQFERFRTGRFGRIFVRFDPGWTCDETVQPLFPVPACVLFAQKSTLFRAVAGQVRRFTGTLAKRNADEDEADALLKVIDEAPAPEATDFAAASPYRDVFRNGATLYPRKLFFVEREDTGWLGTGPRIPVRSWRSPQEKAPWKNLPALTGSIEREFIRPALLGESIAPYRVLTLPEAVVPFDNAIVDSAGALARAKFGLYDWLKVAETAWDTNGRQQMTLRNRYDFYKNLSEQFPICPLRVLFTKAGTLAAACVLRDNRAVVDHMLYWAPVDTNEEGHYLTSILNSETARLAVAGRQARGQWGARHFDKLMFTLPIPRFDPSATIHADLAAAGRDAEALAARVDLPTKGGFVAARRAIRAALREDGIADRIDGLVAGLIAGGHSP